MVYPRNFLRLVASGPLFDVESFSFSLSLIDEWANTDPELDPTEAPEEVPPALITAFSTFFSANPIAGAARLTTLKLNLIGPNGRYVNDAATVVHDFGLPGISGVGTAPYPPQVSLAVSLKTAASRGRAHAGRFYLPAPKAPMGTDGRVTVAGIADLNTHVGNLLNSINEAVPGWVLGVTSDIGEGTQRTVTGFTIGRTFDTIRSRRTSIPEGYGTPIPLD